ncbi:PLK serine/threonine-protein kinase [Vairimorpha necatrix]|uniref:PLK serine/threonine-protein kinase n=1 Tax=Vairimorpha necatrix TaxID=6039 RepID=A0AAX4JD50_9MICR
MASKVELYFQVGTTIVDPEYHTNYIIKKLLGRGAYAQCYLIEQDDGETFAMKIVKLKEIKSKKVHEKLKSEIEIHMKLNHENVVKMYRHFKNEDYIFMVLELCERGGLDSLLKRNGKLKERYVINFVKQIINGLLYLHNDVHVVHRDLKLGNLFLDSKMNIKIGDFGLSALIKEGERKITMCGTPNYIAPEVLFGKEGGHSYEVDIWSLGVIIYTLLIGVPPFQKKNVEEIYKEIKRNNYIYPEDCDLSSEAIDLINSILTLDPMERPGLEEILQHKFLNKREHFLLRIYRNIITNKYKETNVTKDYVLYSIPINKLKGIGYVLKSGLCGFYFNDKKNIMLKKRSIIFIQTEVIDGKKTFLREEHFIENIPEDIMPCYRVLKYFIDTFVHDFEYLDCEPSFIMKIRKIKNGLLFVMADSTLIFDFTNEIRIIIACDGEIVECLKKYKPITFDVKLKDECIEIIKSCLGSK